MVKLLIVDDDESILYTLKNGLELYDENYEIVTVSSGSKCLEKLKDNFVPDLILLDVNMPEMSGWQTFDKIRDNPSSKDIPIIFLTGRTDKIARTAGDFLAQDYIEKPCKIPELKQRIEKVLNKSK